MEIIDRYSAAGIDYPDPKTVCGGDCEGMGIIPVFMKGAVIDHEHGVLNCISEGSEKDPALIKLWMEAEKKEKSKDGYHFVKCPECDGSGEIKLEFKLYKKSSSTEMRPYVLGEEVKNISIDPDVVKEGHPKSGDMVCRDPSNHADQWLITKKYFNDNYSSD